MESKAAANDVNDDGHTADLSVDAGPCRRPCLRPCWRPCWRLRWSTTANIVRREFWSCTTTPVASDSRRENIFIGSQGVAAVFKARAPDSPGSPLGGAPAAERPQARTRQQRWKNSRKWEESDSLQEPLESC